MELPKTKQRMWMVGQQVKLVEIDERLATAASNRFDEN